MASGDLNCRLEWNLFSGDVFPAISIAEECGHEDLVHRPWDQNAMGFYVFTNAEGINFRHDDDPDTVTILDGTMQPISATFEKTHEDVSCAVSPQSNRFVMGTWSRSDLAIFELKSGSLHAAYPFRKVGKLRFDKTGNRLLFKSGSKVILLNLQSGDSMQVDGINSLDQLIYIPEKNEALVGTRKKGEILRVSLETGSVKSISLPIDATFFDLKRSPVASKLILIDRKKGIHCIEMSDWSVIWSVSLKKTLGKDHMGVGQFSGDGSLFGAVIAAFDHNYTIVLDARTGREVIRFDATCEGLPLRGTLMRSGTTHENRFTIDTLDLANGHERNLDLQKQVP